MENFPALDFLLNHYEVVFLYGVKVLRDISINLNDIKVVLAVHETEINILKNRRITDKKD